MHRGVFAVGHAVLRPEGHYLAAVLACGAGSALSFRSAAALWGIRASAAAVIDVTAPRRTGRKKPGLRVHSGQRVLPDELTTVDAVPCTTVARTLLDLAATLDLRGTEAAVESSERLEIFDLRSLTILLARHRRGRGTRRLREVLAAFDPEVLRARTETEARFFHLCAARGIPRPLVNRLVDVGTESFEVDFHWPAARLVVETDSPYHDTTAAGPRDAHRDRCLRLSGWTVIRCRWYEITVAPEPLIAAITAALASPRAATGAFRVV